MKNILIIGNCQADCIYKYIQAHSAGFDVSYVRLLHEDIAELDRNPESIFSRIDTSILDRCDTLVVQSFIMNYADIVGKGRDISVYILPVIFFTGFHPDLFFLRLEQSLLFHSHTFNMHSTLACMGWKNGLTCRQTEDLFNREVFERLGYFTMYDASCRHMETDFGRCGLRFSDFLDAFTNLGCWMHMPSHPLLEVLVRICEHVLPFGDSTPGAMADPFINTCTWGVYPEVAAYLNANEGTRIGGGYEFRRAYNPAVVSGPPILGLGDFIRQSYDAYEMYRRKDVRIVCPRLETPPYMRLIESILPARKRVSMANAGRDEDLPVPDGEAHPYQNLPDHHFWRRSLGMQSKDAFDPIIHPVSRIPRESKVATAGSCFSQHISRRLQECGMNYYLAEQDTSLPKEEQLRRNYGVFSARYGNIYTARQLRQLFERAFGYFTPIDTCWRRPNGRFSDPFRPEIEPDGFASREELEESRKNHLRSVKELFENLDVFVFTFGLTEAWSNRLDGAIYPVAPGVVAGRMDPVIHQFVHFSVAEIVADMNSFIRSLRLVNPDARLILTVSPVPMIATFRKQHVLVANTCIKSALRAAAGEICSQNDRCEYFPSYEIVTGQHARGSYYAEDMRSITPDGVSHVMRIFLKHYTGSESVPEPHAAPHAAQAQILKELEDPDNLVCEEELLET